MLDLPIEEWELLDEDGKADLVDLYYVEKKAAADKVSKAKRQKELRASQKFKDDNNQKRRDVRAGLTKEAKKEASRKRKLAPSYSKKKRKVADALKALGFTSSSSAAVRFCCSAPVDNRQ